MDADLVTYLWGDTIHFSIEVAHDFNLGDAWAVFERREELEGAKSFPVVLDARTVEEVERAGAGMVSRIEFEVTLDRRNSVPGSYDLGTIRALPTGMKRSDNILGVDFGTPEVSFRIAPMPVKPSGEVRDWQLGWKKDVPRRLG